MMHTIFTAALFAAALIATPPIVILCTGVLFVSTFAIEAV